MNNSVTNFFAVYICLGSTNITDAMTDRVRLGALCYSNFAVMAENVTRVRQSALCEGTASMTKCNQSSPECAA